MSKKIIGIDLGGTSIKFAILTQEGQIQEKWSIKTNILDEGSHIVDDMIESILHRLDLLQLTADHFLGIGMGSIISLRYELLIRILDLLCSAANFKKLLSLKALRIDKIHHLQVGFKAQILLAVAPGLKPQPARRRHGAI